MRGLTMTRRELVVIQDALESLKVIGVEGMESENLSRITGALERVAERSQINLNTLYKLSDQYKKLKLSFEDQELISINEGVWIMKISSGMDNEDLNKQINLAFNAMNRFLRRNHLQIEPPEMDFNVPIDDAYESIY